MRPAGFQESTDFARLCLGEARAAWFGPSLDLSPHLNVATVVAVGLDAPFRLRRFDARRGWSDDAAVEVAVVASGTLHHLRSTGRMAFLYLDPASDDVRHLDADRLRHGRRRLVDRIAAASPPTLAEALDAFGCRLDAPRDRRIARVVQAVGQRPQDFARVQAAAELACLSPSRFRARFAHEVGLPFARYRLWRRMEAVMRTVAAGGQLTDAALDAGFASSAHLSATFRRLFGLSPSALIATGVRIELG
jgi:AraC-like DNA-binding protein